MSWRAAKSGHRLTAAQQQDATQMLVRSDNDAALRSYFALGGRPGIEHGLASAFGRRGSASATAGTGDTPPRRRMTS